MMKWLKEGGTKTEEASMDCEEVRDGPDEEELEEFVMVTSGSDTVKDWRVLPQGSLIGIVLYL